MVVQGWRGRCCRRCRGTRDDRGLEVVDNPADGLDVGVLGLPLVVATVIASLHNVHAATEVGLLVHHPAVTGTHTNTHAYTKLFYMRDIIHTFITMAFCSYKHIVMYD